MSKRRLLLEPTEMPSLWTDRILIHLTPVWAHAIVNIAPILPAQPESREENSENLKIVKFLHFHFTLYGRLKPALSPS